MWLLLFLNRVIYTVFKGFFSETGRRKNWQEGIIMNGEIVLYDVSYKVSQCSELMKVSCNTGDSKNRISNTLNICLRNPLTAKISLFYLCSSEYLYKQKYNLQNLLIV